MIELLNTVSPRLIFLILFVTGLGAFLYWDRDKVSRHYILFYRRTKRGIDTIDSVAKKAPRFWNFYGWSGVLTGFLSIVASAALMGYTFYQMIVTKSVEQGPSLIAPGLVSENQFQAGVSFIPIEYWVIGVGVVMFVHEMSHGIVARAEDFELNSVGWIVLGIIPGAFVEPKGENMLPGDEANQDDSKGMWEQGTWKSRLKVLGAGSFANYVTGALFLLLAVGVTGAITQASDVHYRAEEGLPAYESGMRNGSLIQVDGHRIQNLKDLTNASEGIMVNETINVWTSEGNFTVTAIDREGWDTGYIGIRVGTATIVKENLSGHQAGFQWFISLLWTVGLLNVLIGLFNMLPIKPLDGGLMVDTLLKEFMEDKIEYLDRVSLIGWALIMGSVLLGLFAGAL